ncbi:MAG: hypothetical protein ACKVQS_05660 [Fimbriimonadaceae bacterium]
MKVRAALFSLAVTLFAASATCQSSFYRPGQYPSMRNLNGLPGQGYGINRLGHPDFHGAFSYSTPVAYTLTDWHWVLSGTFVSNNLTPRFSDNSRNGGSNSANGTAVLQIGAKVGTYGDFSYGFSVLSSQLDNIGSAQFTPTQTGPVVFAIGVMDVSGSGGSSGFGNPNDNNSSRSPYLVTTYEPTPGTFLSLGYGSTRYRGVFGSVSTTITSRFKALLEYDTFHWNQMLAYDIGKVGNAHLTATLGTQAGRYAAWAISVSF